ncbi:NAD(P)H-dependent oxidoreductase [Arcanobacterium haemolyticum]|nr:NAD(P)H-dependent oxidoreductase [Arcanobacterium haemolyticum]
MKILALSAGSSEASDTTRLADEIARAAGREPTIEIRLLRPFARDIADAMVTGFPSPALSELIDEVAGADALVAATPIYNAVPSGLFVSFFDVLPEETLRGKPVALAATGGSPRHSLIVEHAMRPMMIYLHALVATTAVYAATEDWGAPGVGFDGSAGTSLLGRIAREGRELAALISMSRGNTALPEASHDMATKDDARAETPDDATELFPDFVPFDQMMGK